MGTNRRIRGSAKHKRTNATASRGLSVNVTQQPVAATDVDVEAGRQNVLSTAPKHTLPRASPDGIPAIFTGRGKSLASVTAVPHIPRNEQVLSDRTESTSAPIWIHRLARAFSRSVRQVVHSHLPLLLLLLPLLLLLLLPSSGPSRRRGGSVPAAALSLFHVSCLIHDPTNMSAINVSFSGRGIHDGIYFEM